MLFIAAFSTLQFTGGSSGKVFADNPCPPNSTLPRCTGGNPPGTGGGAGDQLPTTTPTCPGGTTYVDLYNSCLGPKVNGSCPSGTSEVNYVPPPNNCGVNPNAPSSTKQAPTCENVSEDDGWLICPIFNGVSNFTDWMYSNFLQPFLYTAPISTSANDSSFKVWSTFRVYG
ncbi:MAG TPA: hypothetical protein VLG11_06340, partial [Candidatus Saccharimonadales bacterium]|nr:hypothetical protein [Candidatus Saccharimonadales bacterium]